MISESGPRHGSISCGWRIPDREQPGCTSELNEIALKFHVAGSLRTRGPGRVESINTSRLRCPPRRAHSSRRHRRLIQPTTVRLPSIRTDTRAGAEPRPCSVPACARQGPHACDDRCNTVGNRGASVSRSAAVQKSVRSRHSRRMVPISRSTNGCESGTYGTVLISRTSRIRRFACHWWNRYSGSWSELRYVGGVWHRVARLNIRHSPTPSTTPRCTPKPTMRRVQWSITTSTQCVRRTADSHRNKSRLHRLSFA